MKFAKSFSWYERPRLGYGALVGSLIMAMSVFVVIKSYLCQLSVLVSIDADIQPFMTKDASFLQQLGVAVNKSKEMKPVCNVAEQRSDHCEISGEIRVRGKSSTIYVVQSEPETLEKGSWSIRPYARKDNTAAMNLVKNWSIVSQEHHSKVPSCDIVHSVPGILFSLGGFSGNHFHDFSDLVIPLYITSHRFHQEVQFLVIDNRPWWITKFQGVLRKLSRYDIIDIETEESIHCFPSMSVGLEHHKELGIDPSKSKDGSSMKDFRQFLRSTYSLNRTEAIKMRDDQADRPQLLVIFRRGSRSFTNIGAVTRTARSLGYKIVVAEANISTNLSSFAQLVNSCDVLMGIHGAGLTNMVFLPDNAILIQIVPFGGLDVLARDDFAKPAIDMNLRYLEYEIKIKESSLINQYPPDHVIFRDPFSIHKQGWDALRSIYLDKQDVRLDVRRFRTTLLKALELLHQ